MNITINNRTVLVDRDFLLGVTPREKVDESGKWGDRQSSVFDNFDVDGAVEALMNDPDAAARLLYTGNKFLVFIGDDAGRKTEHGLSYGMQPNRNAGDNVFVGDNAFGIFLSDVRRTLREALRNKEMDETPVPEGMVITDFIPAGQNNSAIEEREKAIRGLEASISADRKALDDLQIRRMDAPSEAVIRNRMKRAEDDFNAMDEEFRRVQNLYSLEDYAPYREAKVALGIDKEIARIKKRIRVSQNDIRNLGGYCIHTDVYRPVRFRFDANRAGTTGHAERITSGDNAYESFVCPFGTGRNAKVRVGNAAEVSLYYEQALRGELDWKALMEDLRNRGLNSLSDAGEKKLVADLTGRFDWMREQICSNDDLKEMPIVAESLLIPDTSMGRSSYDARYAPSPAHILARYIQNPVLLYCKSANGVIRAMEETDKHEMTKFAVNGTPDEVNIIVTGSDTIGGRVPGTRATSHSVSRKKFDSKGRPVLDAHGNQMTEVTREWRLQFKPEPEVLQDYAQFASRMDEILSGIPEEVKINFITGDGSGTPNMVAKYVLERKGTIMKWDYNSHQAVGDGVNKDPRFTAVKFSRFNEALPVIIGRAEKAEFYANEEGRIVDEILEQGFENQDASEYKASRNVERGRSKLTLRKDELPAIAGGICYSVNADASNRYVLNLGSTVASAGIPVVHVMENSLEEEQLQTLNNDSQITLSSFSGAIPYDGTLFGEDGRKVWAMDESSSVMSDFAENVQFAVPQVFSRQVYPVFVAGTQFLSVYGTYGALLLTEIGQATPDNLKALADREGTMNGITEVLDRMTAGFAVTPEQQERAMRSAAHMVAHSNRSFADRLVATDGKDIVFPASNGDNVLFTDLDGNGENRFGIVLMAERDFILTVREQTVRKAQAERQKQIDDALRLERHLSNKKAEGEKMASGLPKSLDAAEGAVWFLGTHRPVELILPDEKQSFEYWNECSGEDPLTREIASRQKLDSSDGEVSDNDLVFIGGTNQAVISGRQMVRESPDSRDLHGVKRVDPATGEAFVCGFGIPVKNNGEFYEEGNKYGMPSSFRTDNDSTTFINSIVATDAAARYAAIEHKCALCMAVDEPPRNSVSSESILSMSRVFKEKIWAARTITREQVEEEARAAAEANGTSFYNEFHKREDKIGSVVLRKNVHSGKMEQIREWQDNPHYAPRLDEALARYRHILQEGADFPLNMIALPSRDYTTKTQSPEEMRRQEAAFVADLKMALGIASATAVSLGVPMRFPLTPDGKIDLGPDVPENLRQIAENRINEFIGVTQNQDFIKGKLPVMSRVRVTDCYQLPKDGSVLKIRPNALVSAFGRYEFGSVGLPTILHEMGFRMEDGTKVKLTGTQLSSKLPLGDVNKYLAYEKNDELLFRVGASDVSKIPEAIRVIRSYVEKASQIGIEVRLLKEGERGSENLGMNGYIDLLSSNSSEMGDGQYVFSPRSIDALSLNNRFDGTDGKGNTGDAMSEYYGKVDAGDGFTGYVQYRYTLPDGTQSDWLPIKDTELRLDTALSLVNRVYKLDEHKVPPMHVIETMLRSCAIDDAGEKFRVCASKSMEHKMDDKVNHDDINASPKSKTEELDPVPNRETENVTVNESKEGRVLVSFYGTKNIPEDSVLVQISTSSPKGLDVDYHFASLYPDFKQMEDPHKKGVIDDAEYTRRYVEKVLVPNKEKIIEGISIIKEENPGKDIILDCYCSPGQFCHRYVLNNWLNENGIACEENSADKALYRQGRVVLFGEPGYVPGTLGVEGFEMKPDAPKKKAVSKKNRSTIVEI